MARIKLVYLGGGSTRAAGTMASFMANGSDFDGSEVVLVDLDPDRLELIRTLADEDGPRPRPRHRRHRHDRPARRARRLRRRALVVPPRRLRGARARRAHPARARRHRPGDAGRRRLLHGAARDHRAARTSARRWRSSARTPGSSTTRTPSTSSPRRSRTTRRSRSCRSAKGPIYFRDTIAESAGLDPALLDVTMVGLNHGCWGVEQSYDGQDPMPLLAEAWERRRDDPTLEPRAPAPAPARGRDGRDPGRLLPVLLLHRRGARRVPGQADDARGGHPRLVDRLLAPLRGAGAERTTRSSIPPAHAAASTSSSSRST